MDTRTYLRAFTFIMWRVTQVLVIYPAAAVGLFLAVMTFMGQRPVEGTLEIIYHYAETNIRPAKPGHVLVVDCVTHAETSRVTNPITKPPLVCDSTTSREVSIAEVIASAVRSLQTLYWVLVVLSFGALLIAMPDRRKLLSLSVPTTP